MAKMSVQLPDSLAKQFAALANRSPEVAEKMLNAGMEPLEKAVRANLASHRDTGELIDSYVRTKVTEKNGVWRVQGTFRGESKSKYRAKKGKKKVVAFRNFQKVLAMEYGTGSQPATPVIRPAVAASEAQSLAAMQKVFDEAVKDLEL